MDAARREDLDPAHTLFVVIGRISLPLTADNTGFVVLLKMSCAIPLFFVYTQADDCHYKFHSSFQLGCNSMQAFFNYGCGKGNTSHIMSASVHFALSPACSMSQASYN